MIYFLYLHSKISFIYSTIGFGLPQRYCVAVDQRLEGDFRRRKNSTKKYVVTAFIQPSHIKQHKIEVST